MTRGGLLHRILKTAKAKDTKAIEATTIDQEETDFESLSLPSEILRAIEEEGYHTPTPIQVVAIPPALEGRDVLGCAQTGTGKTAAFGLPILARLSEGTFARTPRALVLTPTRELAMQVEEFLRNYGRHLKLRYTTIVGGMAFGPQVDALRKGVDVVIATPGRLIDLERQGSLKLSGVEILVLDEADRMLDMGFIPDIRRILRMLSSRKQTLLFSATLPEEITRLAADFLNDPVRVEVAPPSTPVEKVRQVIHPVDFQRKGELLLHLLESRGMRQVLVFTRTRQNADVLDKYLDRKGESSEAIHGDKTQAARMRALADFKEGRVRVLVATDVASRGIDIEAISHVVNFDMPDSVEDYVHRIGRTARADAEGDAISLVSFEDWDAVRAIERTTGQAIPRVMIPGFEPTRGRFMVEASKPDHVSSRRAGLLRRCPRRRRR